jgi:Flp pilus assembly pilin Flp
VLRSQPIKRFCVEEDAATTVEYAVVLMLILLVVISAVQYFGESVSGNFGNSSDQLNGALGD